MTAKPSRKQVAVFVLFVVVIALIIVTRPPPLPSLDIPLADGTHLKLVETRYGKGKLQFRNGIGWRQILSRLAHASSPWDTFAITPAHTNGAIGLMLRRYNPDGHLTDAWNGSERLTVLDDQKNEQTAHRHMVSWKAAPVPGTNWMPVNEDIYYEIPMVRLNEMQFNLLETNKATTNVTAHTFAIPNPFQAPPR